MARLTLPERLDIIWWPTVSQPTNLAAPTAANIAAGTSLIGNSQGEGLAEMNGWELSPSVIETPDYVTHVVGTVSGDSTIPESSIALYMDTVARVLYDLFTRGDTGVVGIFFDGSAVGEESFLYVVTVQNKKRRFARDDANKVDLDFALSVPVDGVVVA
jgi:hypothetical protein